MASVSRALCFQALTPTSGLNYLLKVPYYLEMSGALSFPDLKKGKVFACKKELFAQILLKR